MWPLGCIWTYLEYEGGPTIGRSSRSRHRHAATLKAYLGRSQYARPYHESRSKTTNTHREPLEGLRVRVDHELLAVGADAEDEVAAEVVVRTHARCAGQGVLPHQRVCARARACPARAKRFATDDEGRRRLASSSDSRALSKGSLGTGGGDDDDGDGGGDRGGEGHEWRFVVCVKETELDTDSFGWAQSPFRGCVAVDREEDEAESLFFLAAVARLCSLRRAARVSASHLTCASSSLRIGL